MTLDALTPEQPVADMPSGEPLFEINTSRHVIDWLLAQKISLAFSTYQVGKLFLIGVKPDGKLWVYNRTLGRCLGLNASGPALTVATDTQILTFVDMMAAMPRPPAAEDALFAPQVGHFTGDLDAHDLARDRDGRILFANTLFNCVATVSETHSFTPVWQPRFISRLAAEDRCHLNGLALKDGRLTHVTAIADSDTFDGWRGHRRDGGILIDVESGEIALGGLSMPHSPRWHQDRLYLHNSGTGEFGCADLASGRFEPITFCPGYLRGLAFSGNFAIVGLSKPRDNKTFTGLPLDDALAARKMEARCGIYVIDLSTGAIAHSLTIEGLVSELYDVVALPGLRQPAMLSPASPELKHTISLA